VPVGDVLVSDAGGDVKHDDTALPIDIVSITETTKLLLSRSVPDIELDVAQVCAEPERMNFDTESCDILLLKFTRQMALDEGSLSGSSITDKYKLEGGDRRSSSCFGHIV